MDAGRHRLYVRLRLCGIYDRLPAGGLITREAVFSLWTVVAVAALAGILFLLFRKGYQGEHETHNLTSVAAAAK